MRRSRRTLDQASLREMARMSLPQLPEGLLAPKLPQERDRTPEPVAGRDRAKVACAAADLAAGRTDTDCYGAARRVFARVRRGRSR